MGGCQRRSVVAVLGRAGQQRPALLGGEAHDVDDFLHLVALEGHRLLAVSSWPPRL